MSHKTILIFIVAILFIGCRGKPKNRAEVDSTISVLETMVDSIEAAENYVKLRSLLGKVKKIHSYDYDNVTMKFGEIIKGEPIERFTIYNPKGKVISSYFKNWSKNTHFKKYFEYDDNNNIIKINEYKSDGSLHKSITYKYNSKGKLIDRKEYNSEGNLKDRYTYKYNFEGNELEVNHYIENGTLNSKEMYEYYDNGIKKTYNIYNYKKDGKFDTKSTYKYDKKGKVIESNDYHIGGHKKSIYSYDNKGLKTQKYIQFYDNDPTFQSKGLEKFDANDNVIERYIFLVDKYYLDEIHTYKYNKIGEILEKNSYLIAERGKFLNSKRGKFLISKISNKYDRYDNLIEKNYWNWGGGGAMETTQLYENQYKYDKENNWIEKKHYSNKILDGIIEREIEYYK